MAINAGIAAKAGEEDYRSFFEAVRADNRDHVLEFVARYPDSVRTLYPVRTGKTALHVAFLARHLNMAKLLLERMMPEDLEIEAYGFTAFAEAVRQGAPRRIVKTMADMNSRIIEIRDRDRMLPVTRAFVRNDFNLGTSLYSKTPSGVLLDPQENSINGATVLTSAIRMQLFDIADKLVKSEPSLALAKDFEGKTALFVLACSSSVANVLDIPKIKVKRKDTTEVDDSDGIDIDERLGMGYLNRSEFLTELLTDTCSVLRTLDDSGEKIDLIHEAIVEATDRDNVHFIEVIAKANPHLLGSCVDRDTGMNVLQRAIRSRNAYICRLLLRLPSRETMLSHEDKNRNNALHTAGVIAPTHQLSRISKAATVRLRSELRWFKEIEEIIPYHKIESKNKKKMTPRDVFTTTHKGLVQEAVTWIKETSSHCMLTASLVITVMFAAAITVPGGTKQDTGLPIFRDENLFKVFMAWDVLSVFLATASLQQSVAANKGRYAEEDFFEDLPKKITVGLSLLWYSVMSMFIAFCCVVAMMLKREIAIPTLVGAACFTFWIISALSYMPAIIRFCNGQQLTRQAQNFGDSLRTIRLDQ